jgi:hypothetical protein
MKHAWGLLLLIGCGTSGEPMKGDVAFDYGTSHPKMVVGSAVMNKDTPAEMVVQLGDDNIDCGTNLDQFVLLGGPTGTFVFFSVDASTPGAHASTAIQVEHATGNDTSIDESSGDVTIDTIDTRVTGSLTFMTTDDKVGAISVSGNFDVKRCF